MVYVKNYERKGKLSLARIKDAVGADTISRKDDVITVRKSFFYSMGKTANDFVNKVKQAFPEAEIMDSGKRWVAFRGGASVANQSHWWVKFKLN